MENWQDLITVPMPKIYIADEDFIGKKVILHSCEFHENLEPAKGWTREEVSFTGNCNCKIKGKVVTITGLKQTIRARFYRSICYTIAESKNLIHEFEFSPETLDKRPVTAGYIIEGEENHFLTAGRNYVMKNDARDGYLHNTGVVKSLLKSEALLVSIPTKVYPAEYNWDTESIRITGPAISWDELRGRILVK